MNDELKSNCRSPVRGFRVIEPPPPDEWDRYADKVLAYKGKLPKNFAKIHSPDRHRPRSSDWMKEQARRAYGLCVEERQPKEVMAREQIRADQYENWWSQFNKDIDRYAQICFRSSIVLWMSKTRSAGSTKTFNIEKAEKEVWMELRRHLYTPNAYSQEAFRATVRCLNKRYLDKLVTREKPYCPPRFASEFCKLR